MTTKTKFENILTFMILYNLIIVPIETIVDWAFIFFTVKFPAFGVIGAVCGVSLVINFLALPLYNIADSLQERERKAAKALERGVKMIKKAFKGNEQFMMLSTYYRQNNYHPLYVLRSSLSILIEIPFFIAAYHYLSHCEALKGSSFWIFRDLGAPDGLLHIGKFPINVLPIVMTLINFISGAIYARDAPFREKIQLYLVAMLFLVLLYKSPSGLVIYWILNNIFSLVKNIVMKMKHPERILHVTVSVLFLAASFYFFKWDGSSPTKKTVFLLFSLAVTLLPLIRKLLKKTSIFDFKGDKKIDFLLTLFSGIGLALLYGYLIPANIISTSPEEFSFLGKTDSPMTYIYNSSVVFAGFFVLWPLMIFKLFDEKVSKHEGLLLFTVLILSLFNVYLFDARYGTLNIFLEPEDTSHLIMGKNEHAYSILAGIIVITLVLMLREFVKTSRFLYSFAIAVCIAELCVGSIKVASIRESYSHLLQNRVENKGNVVEKEYNLSSTKNNVVVLFLDRAIDTFIPEIFKKFPEIERQFSGFTYYPNTLSFSDYTVQGTPPMMGGYEYSPEEMNRRSGEFLKDKHTEATLVMPKLFSDAGFETTVTDSPLQNYTLKGDLEIFNEYPYINAKNINGKYFPLFKEQKMLKIVDVDKKCNTGFIDFAVLQALPPFLRITFSNTAKRHYERVSSSSSFFEQLSNLYYLPQMTGFDADKNTFAFIANDTAHEPWVYLQEDYETPAEIQSDDNTLLHYQANVAALKQVGKWLDYLRENKVFDNTRIIIVSDHGRGIKIPRGNKNVARYSALLMVKDFNSNGSVKTNNEFMTNADTLFLAKNGLPVSDINPFTEKKLTQQKSAGINVYHCGTIIPFFLLDNEKFSLDKTRAFHVSENIFDEKNWIPLTEWEKSNGD